LVEKNILNNIEKRGGIRNIDMKVKKKAQGQGGEIEQPMMVRTSTVTQL